jgi:hypothetical protein
MVCRLLILTSVFFWNVNTDTRAQDLCEIIHLIEKDQPIDLHYESRIIGKCQAAIYWTNVIKDEFDVDLGNYYCDKDVQINVASYERMFAEDVRYAIQLEKIIRKKNKTQVTYSILEFFHGKRSDSGTKKLLTKKVTVQS